MRSCGKSMKKQRERECVCVCVCEKKRETSPRRHLSSVLSCFTSYWVNSVYAQSRDGENTHREKERKETREGLQTHCKDSPSFALSPHIKLITMTDCGGVNQKERKKDRHKDRAELKKEERREERRTAKGVKAKSFVISPSLSLSLSFSPPPRRTP